MHPDHKHAKLLSRIQRRYRTVTSPVKFGPVEFAFTRVADPNRVLDDIAAEEDRREKTAGIRYAEPLHLPYWAELWDSGGGVAMFLVDRFKQGLAGKTILDLGCGQGLVGCVIAALGGAVLFADLEAPALLFAQLNASHISTGTRTRRLNWQKDHLQKTFDLIVGADILYERSQWVFLEPFWTEHLVPRGTILLGEPGRPTGDGFIDWIQTKGWQIHVSEQRVITRERPIRIFELRR